MLNIISEQYETDNITVSLDWPEQVGAMYTVRVVPPIPIIFTGSTDRQLTISYNTVYSFSVVATTPWGNTTAFITLQYGEGYIFSMMYYIVTPTHTTTIMFNSQLWTPRILVDSK